MTTDIDKVLEGLPAEVVNQLAIWEDRYLRAEERTARLGSRNAELRAEIGRLRTVLRELTDLADELQGRSLANATLIEETLKHVVVIQAG